MHIINFLARISNHLNSSVKFYLFYCRNNDVNFRYFILTTFGIGCNMLLSISFLYNPLVQYMYTLRYIKTNTFRLDNNFILRIFPN